MMANGNAGVGFSQNARSREAGVEAASDAMERAGPGRWDLALVFATSRHDPVELRNGIRSVIGPDTRLIGGSAVGIITQDRISYGGYEAGVALLSARATRFDLFRQDGLDKDERQAGVELGRQIARNSYRDPGMLLLYDSIRGPGALNMATPLIEGLVSSLKEEWPRVCGVGLLGDMQFSGTCQWFDDRVDRQSALALVLDGELRMDTVIMHGCRPAGSYRKITRTDGPVVLEIEGRPAIEVIGELLGPSSGMAPGDYPLFVTLGVNKGDRFGAFKEENYANRLCVGLDEKRGGLVMFEPDLKAGMEIQLMRRSVDLEYMKEGLRHLDDRLAGREPVLAFYIDCAGRAKAFCGMDREDASEIQAWAAGRVPLLGIYSGVEIARVGGNLQALDWTGVLSVFSV